MRHIGYGMGVLVVLSSAWSCARDSSAQTAERGTIQPIQQASPPGLVNHPDHIPAGATAAMAGVTLTNPFEGNKAAIAEGSKLFVAYNCVDCHGAEGSGAMGPSFQDGRWHFGGTAGNVFESIYEGRPDGMPAWGGLLNESQIWKLVTYVRSVEDGHHVTTENFTSKGVQRAGH